jgi:hypothetical protein
MNLLIITLIITGIDIAAVGFYRRRVHRNMEQAKVQAAWLNKELEQPNPRIRVVEIWFGEQIEKYISQAANAS